MEQLLIVKSAAAKPTGTPANLSNTNVKDGAVGFYALGTNSWLAAKPTKDFAIVLGRGVNSPALVIPEVNVNNLLVSVANYAAGVKYSGAVTVPEVVAGSRYTLVLVKKGAKFNERNTWTATVDVPLNSTKDAADVAEELANYFKNAAKFGALNISVTQSDEAITIAGLVDGEDFALKGADALSGVTVTETTAKKAVGDKAYVEDLASRCAAGKGFTDTYADGATTIPGYPEPVESAQYKIYTLRFAVGRKAAKTRDEVVSQIVHIAVPSGYAGASDVNTILGSFPTP